MYCFAISHVTRKTPLLNIFSILLFQMCLGSNVNFREYYGTRVPPPVTAIPEADKLTQMSNIRSETECFSLCMTYSKCGMIVYSVSDEVCIVRKIKQLPGATSFIDIPANSIYTVLQAPECPTSAGYIYRPEFRLCFQIGSKEISWNDAADNCNNDRGRLIHLKNLEVNNYIRTLIASSLLRNKWFHFGVFKDDSKNVFAWQNGDALVFTFWRSGSPDNYGGNQKCTALDPRYGHKWNDIDCGIVNLGIHMCEIVVL
ncbi:macrophage mannose receptor 1 [Octopus bimaculoides]|nr:macrophage mannose receptor 1 [Octopus bimaculoides]